MTAPDAITNPRRNAMVLATATFFTIVPVTLLVPVLKRLVQDTWQVGDFATSTFMSVNMLGAFITAPLAGLISDRLGRRKPLIVGALICDAVFLSALAHAPSFGTLMAIRFFEGCAHIFALSLVLAIAADTARAAGSGRLMGIVGAALTLGIALGAPLGGVIGRTDPERAYTVGGALAALAAVIVAVIVREAPRAQRPKSAGDAVGLLRTQRKLAIPYAFAFVDRFTVGFFISSFPLYVGNVLGADSARTGLLMALFLLPFALLCYPAGRLSERYSRVTLIAGGSLVYGVLVTTVGLVPEALLPYLMVALGVVSSVMFVPTLMLTGEIAPSTMKATAMGGFNAAGSLGFLVGPAVAGKVSEWVGSMHGAHAGYATSFVVAGVAEISCVLLTLAALRRLQASESRSPATAPVGSGDVST